MKRLCVFLALICSTVSFAKIDYTCFLPKEANSGMIVTVYPEHVVLRAQKEIVDTDSWEIKTGKAVFDRKGIIGGTGKMRGKVLYSINFNTSQVLPQSGVSSFFLDQDLIIGGRELRPGFRGGLMTFVNPSKLYDSYVCYRKMK